MSKKPVQSAHFYTDIFSLIFLLCVAVIFYFPIVFNKIPAPLDTLVGLYHPWRDFYSAEYPRGIPFKNFLITDPIRQQIPWRKLVIDAWKSGHIPAVNNTSFMGASLLGNIQSGALYPLNIVFFFFSFQNAWTILIVIQTILSSIFMYIFLRSEEFEPLPASWGALAFSFCGFSIAWLTWGTIVQTALWLPLLLFLSKNVILQKNRRIKILSLLGFGFGIFSCITAGHLQISFYVVSTVAAFCLYLTFKNIEGKNVAQYPPKKERFLGLAFLVMIISVVAFLLFPLILEFIRNFLSSSRIVDGLGYRKEGFFIPWEHGIQFLIPDFFGNPATLNYWGKWNYGEFIGYIGVIPFLFSIYGIFSKRISFWHFVLLFSLMFAFPTVLAYLPYTIGIPGLSSMQPTRLMVLIDFSLCWFLTFGIQKALNDGIDKNIFKIFSASFVGIALGLLGMYGASKLNTQFQTNFIVTTHNMVTPLLFIGLGLLLLSINAYKVKKTYLVILFFLFLSAFDLYRFGSKFTPFSPASYFFPETKVIQFLATQPKPFRILSLDDRIIPPNVSGYYGIESVGGYDPVINARLEEFIGSYERMKPNIDGPFGFNRIISPKAINTSLLPVLNVKYVLSLSDLNERDLTLVFREGETRIYEYSAFLPRVFIAGKTVQVSSKKEEIQALFDLKGKIETKGIVTEPIILDNNATGSANIVQYEANHMVIQTNTTGKQLLVVTNTFLPEWHALIDGATSPIVRTDYIFQGLVVPSGNHTIDLFYEI